MGSRGGVCIGYSDPKSISSCQVCIPLNIQVLALQMCAPRSLCWAKVSVLEGADGRKKLILMGEVQPWTREMLGPPSLEVFRADQDMTTSSRLGWSPPAVPPDRRLCGVGCAASSPAVRAPLACCASSRRALWPSTSLAHAMCHWAGSPVPPCLASCRAEVCPRCPSLSNVGFLWLILTQLLEM